MDNVRKIAAIDNIVEAQMLESLLQEQGIPYLLKSYHDSAYDGLFQSQKGWGHIEAPAEYGSEIRTLLGNLRIENKPDSPQDIP